MAVYIGTSGWSYDHWDGVLYPHGLPPAARLGLYLDRYGTVEVNSTFYYWPRDTTFTRWRAKLPWYFHFTVKAPRGLTHGARLYAPEKWIGHIARGLGRLGDNRGILLVQLPPDFSYDFDRIAYFLGQIPHWVRVALEFRHPSWNQDAIFDLLEQKGAGYCIMSGAQLPCILRVTSSFAYVRMHGPDQKTLYGGSYSDDDLRWWRDRIFEWSAGGRDVYVYFNNDGGGNAVRNADTLQGLCGS